MIDQSLGAKRSRQKVIEILSINLREITKLDHIHPTLTGFALGDERLRNAETAGDLDLGQTGELPGGPEPLDKKLVVALVAVALQQPSPDFSY